MSVMQNRIFYINSENRITGTSSNFSYQLEIPKDQKYDSCCVLAMTIPRSYYLIRDGQNSCTLTVNGTSYPFTVSPGNYTAINFQPVLLGMLNAFGVGTFTMALSSITGKYTYSYSGTGSVVSFTLADPSRLGTSIGLPRSRKFYFCRWNTRIENVLDFISTTTLFLHWDMVMDKTSILQEVYADNTVPFNNLVYNCRDPNMYSKAMQNTQSGVFNFSLCDEHNLEVDLNGQDICVTLLMYKKENLTGSFSKPFSSESSEYDFSNYYYFFPIARYIYPMSSEPAMHRPDNLNYKPTVMHNGRYRFHRLALNNSASNSFVLSANATQMIEWKIPARTIFNPARTSLDYQITIPAQGALTYMNSFEDCFEICQGIQLCNASGVYLCDLQYANNYTAVARKIDITKSDFECADVTSDLYKCQTPYCRHRNCWRQHLPAYDGDARSKCLWLRCYYDFQRTDSDRAAVHSHCCGSTLLYCCSDPCCSLL